MHAVLRTGFIALAAGSLVAGVGLGIQSASAAGTVTVTASELVLQPEIFGHRGIELVTVHNGTDQPFQGAIGVTEPIIGSLDANAIWPGSGGGCLFGAPAERRLNSVCPLDAAIDPGADKVVAVPFQTVDRPEPYARTVAQTGQVDIFAGGQEQAVASTAFTARFLGQNPSQPAQPWVQDTATNVAVTAPAIKLTKQSNGTYAGTGQVTIRNNGNAPQSGGWTGPAFTLPAGKGLKVTKIELGSCPAPSGTAPVTCSIMPPQIAQDDHRTFAITVTAPSTTKAGSIGTAKVTVNLAAPVTAQTNGANTASFAITAG